MLTLNQARPLWDSIQDALYAMWLVGVGDGYGGDDGRRAVEYEQKLRDLILWFAKTTGWQPKLTIHGWKLYQHTRQSVDITT